MDQFISKLKTSNLCIIDRNQGKLHTIFLLRIITLQYHGSYSQGCRVAVEKSALRPFWTPGEGVGPCKNRDSHSA